MTRVTVLVGALVLAPMVTGIAVSAADDGPGHVVLTFRDPDIVESSGLVLTHGLFVTMNDSGDTGRVFSVAPDGDAVGVTQWGTPDDDAVDVEGLAPACADREPGVWVGDIGDNAEARDSIRVVKVPVGRGDLDATGAPRYTLTYPDAAHDAETLLCDPADGRLYVVTKGFLGGTVYAAPKRLTATGVNRLKPVASTIPIATDGAFWLDGRHLVVRGYAGARVYAWPSMDVVGALPLPSQKQGEGIAVDTDGRVFVSTEGAFSDVQEVPVPRALRRALAPLVAASGGSPSTSPSQPATAVLPEDERTSAVDHAWWTWLVGGAAAVLVVLVLGRVWILSRRR
ncbi:SdiA-regulated/phytase-like domain-containing protein [Nocardioides acrostichi]|uniref:Uncharacterized protein n=1 Tax=Nocardioides acrostichi TaxID=2784339 RepID=A0A930UX12_9ACTN|nr:hypothetical protein [Nocardioides acrostichi]MBF4162438.1 hypothetical protein [Nocardioides acrostichi]